MASGTYLVNDEMIEYLKTNPMEHASNLGALLASDIARIAGVDAFIVDPVVVDEMTDMATHHRPAGDPRASASSMP